MDRKPNVGVLLPVRLETRFYAPDATHPTWRLRVLVVPDEPWIDRHDPVPFEAELDSVERLWQTAQGDLTTELGKAAWRTFVEQHGGARAAWLARTFPPLPPADGVIRITRPADTRTTPHFSQISGFPQELELWLGRGGAAPVRIAHSSVQVEQLRLDFPDPNDANDTRWWSSWKRAVEIGLGIEVELGPNQPDDIDVLYVIGLGGGHPAQLFRDHRDSGALAPIEPGTPTNTVDGAPAADLGRDPETWRRIALAPEQIGTNSQIISQALIGKPDALGALPNDTFDHRTPGQALMTALWPVLWSHTLKDIWGVGGDVLGAGLWAGGYVIPEGPLPPIRINDQPYGLLPVTSLRDWQPNSNDPISSAIEKGLQPSLLDARTIWSNAARTAGNVVDAETERLLTLLGRTSSSNTYAYRYFLAIDLLYMLYWLYDNGMSWSELIEWWDRTAQPSLAFPVTPQRRYASLGWPQDLRIPLVAPDDVPSDRIFGDWLAQFFNPEDLVTWRGRFWFTGERGDPEHPPSGKLPESLLVRLLLHAGFVTAAEVHRTATQVTGPALEPVAESQEAFTTLARAVMSMSDQDLAAGGPVVEVYHRVRDAIIRIIKTPVGELDRILRATLDTAAYRIDPFITAYAWRRLQQARADTHTYQLGLYGWVDAPRPGSPGPTAGGLLHTPSEQQAIAAVILRDKALNDPQLDRWQINLESSTIRLAAQTAEEVRIGAHIQEVLGHAIERIAGKKATIDTLRKDFPMRTEHAGRRVCNGEAILKADPATLPLDAHQQAALEPLRRALDTYGDLLVAEAVYHVVAGRGAVAGAAMEAAAGLGGAPNLEVISTQRTGRSVNTNVVVALPNVAEPVLTADSSPGEIADAAVAAFLTTTLGHPDTVAWRWEVFRPDGTVGEVFLADLQLQPIDAVVLSEEELARQVLEAAPEGSVLETHWPATLPDGTTQIVRVSDLGLTPSEIVIRSEQDLRQLVVAAAPVGSVVGAPLVPAGVETQRRARRIIDVLGSQPAVPENLVDTGAQPSDAAVRQNLVDRYQRLCDAAVLAITALHNAEATGDTTALQHALRLAARWGVTPVAQVEDTLAERVVRARSALDERLGSAPAVDDLTQRTAQQIATTIAELAAPEGQLAVLSRIDLNAWPTTFTAAPAFDDEWLTTNAAVRTPLAHLEAHQFDSALGGLWPRLHTWSNRPTDPWQLNPPTSANGAPLASRLITVYGPAGVLPVGGDTVVAAGLLESWGETVPDVEQATTAAFGFNAPAARAPQAILLAVSPDENVPLTAEVVQQIVAETRDLAHARMAMPADLHALDAVLPLMMLPASGITAVALEP